MSREKISRRQKDVSRLLRDKKKMEREMIKKTRKKPSR
jgi:hypothetical protein